MGQGISFGVLGLGIVVFLAVTFYFLIMVMRIKKTYKEAIERRQDVKKHGLESTGKIIKIEKIEQEYKADDNTKMTIEYELSLDEKIYSEIKCYIEEEFELNFEIGGTIPLLYDPENTSRVVINENRIQTKK